MRKHLTSWDAFFKQYSISIQRVLCIETWSQVYLNIINLLDNILVGDCNDYSTIKLADFGLSAKYEHSSFTTLDQHCGTLIFMAPEVAFNKEYSKSVDLWSTGIILYMLLTGGSHPLFTSKDNAETYK